MFSASVGQVSPFHLPDTEGGLVSLEEGGGMHYYLQMTRPTPTEILAFREGRASFGVVDTPSFPWGLLMLAWDTRKGYPIIQEAPMAISVEKRVHPTAVSDWLNGKANALFQFVIEREGNRIVAMRALGLNSDLVGHITRCWQRQLEQGCDYNKEYQQLIARYETGDLWQMAHKYELRKR